MEDKIKKVVDLAAPVSRVWKAITDHEQFGEWFQVKLEGPFKAGELSLGQITYPGHEHIRWVAMIECMEPERLFSLSSHPHILDADTYRADEPATLVEFKLEPTDNGTRLTIIESGFSTLPEDVRADIFRGNSEGWAEQVKNITAYVER